MSDSKKFAGKKLLLIGDSGHYKFVIEKAKELGIHTIALSKYANAAGKVYADESVLIDMYDKEAVLEYARSNYIDGIFTSWNEINLTTADYVATNLNLPFYANKEQIDALVTKFAFKQTCRKYGVPVIPEFFMGEKLTEGDIEKFEYPVIFKPVDAGGTKGMTILYSSDGIKEAEELAGSNSLKQGRLIVEKYIESRDLFVADFIVVNGTPYFVSAADRFLVEKTEKKVPLSIAFMYPSKFIDEIDEQVKEPICNMIRGLGIKNGVLSIEGIKKENKLYMIEAQFRFGGTHFYKVIEEEYGIDLMKRFIEYSLTGTLDGTDLDKVSPRFHRPYAHQNLQMNGGKVCDVRGIDEVLKIKGVDWILQIKNTGDIVPDNGSTECNYAKVGLSADSENELYRLMDKVQHTVEVIDADGSNLIRQNMPGGILE